MSDPRPAHAPDPIEVEVVKNREVSRVKVMNPSKWSLKDVALAVVVLVTAFAAWSSSVAERHSSDAVTRVEAVASCLQANQQQTADSLHARSAALAASVQSGSDLDIAQRDFLTSIALPDATQKDKVTAYNVYLKALQTKIDASAHLLDIQAQSAYPTSEQVKAC